jgi:HEAT repeat protein
MRNPVLTIVSLLLILAPYTVLAQETESADVDTLELAALTPEELFLRASSSALQFQHMLEPSRKILVRDYERSIPYLVTMLDTDDPRERNALEDILVRIGTPAVGPVVEALLAEAARPDTTRGVRLAATVLGRLEDAAAVEPLASVADHPDWKARGAIAGALGRIGTATTVAPLVSLLADPNETVRKSAVVGLRRVAARATDEEEPDLAALRALDDRVLRALAHALADPHYSVRYGASDALATVGGRALPLLEGVVTSGAGAERLMALRAIGAIGSRKSLSTLSVALKDPDWTVRAYAATAAGKVGPDKETGRALERLASGSDHPFVTAAAAAALEHAPREHVAE